MLHRENRHIIQHLTLDLRCEGVSDGFAFQQLVSRICREQLEPALDELFSRYSGVEDVVRLDKLSIEVGNLSEKNFQADFVERVVTAIEKKLSEIHLQMDWETTVEKVPLRASQFSHWLHWLKTGNFSWQSAQVPEAEWQEAVLSELASENAAVQKLTELLRNNHTARVRLVRQHPENFLIRIAGTVSAREQWRLGVLKKEIQGIIAVWAKVANKSFAQFDHNLNEVYWLEVVSHFVLIRPPAADFYFLKNLFQIAFPAVFPAEIFPTLREIKTLVDENPTEYMEIQQAMGEAPESLFVKTKTGAGKPSRRARWPRCWTASRETRCCCCSTA